MRLKAFRVQNYKKINDTGWVTCRDLTVFVGKNEAGKSAIFRGLSKLNPSDGQPYDGLKEFPRRRYSDEFQSQDWPVSSARFQLDDKDIESITEICSDLSTCAVAEVTKHYSGKQTVAFEPRPQSKAVYGKEYVDELDKIIQKAQKATAPTGQGEVFKPIKESWVSSLSNAKTQVKANQVVAKTLIDNLVNELSAQANEDWVQKILEPISKILEDFQDRTAIDEKRAKARSWILSNMPKFIYFDRYDVIDSTVHLPSFQNQLANTPNAPRVRTTHCLFRHVGLDIQKIAGLGKYQQGQAEAEAIRKEIDEKAILASSASNAMTKKFESWWDQRKHKFRYQFDGDYFRIWVSDDLDESEIELDQRSAGMQYFFSFFIVFLVEAEDIHHNSILLLDEPALHLHGTAQTKTVKFLEKLSKDNQTLYSTHSPFMVDVDHLEYARAVFEDVVDGSTKISEDVWPRDKDSLFPLQAALGYQLAQALFISKKQLIVEGITDLWLLKALNHALGQAGKTTLNDEIVIVPSAGTSKLLPLASMLMGHNVDIAALLDGDEPGRKEGKKLTDKLFAADSSRCLFIGDFVTANADAELEDLFPETQYIETTEEAYPGTKIALNAAEKKLVGIVNKLEAFFARSGTQKFEKWKVNGLLRDKIFLKPSLVDANTLQTVEEIFIATNKILS